MKINLNTITDLDFAARRQIADKLFTSINWESQTVGYLQCPGRHLHTKQTRQTDCRITIDGTPTIFCFHQNCASTINRLNKKLRNKIGTTNPGLRMPSPKKKAVNRQSVKDGLTHILSEYSWSPSEAFEQSPTPLGDDIDQDWRLHVSLFLKTENPVWIGSRFDSGKPQHARNFKSPKEWLNCSKPLGGLTCPSTFKEGAYSRSNQNVASQPFFVAESDTLTPEESCSVFQWMRQFLRLTAIVHSGNKSLHGWFGYPSKDQLEELKILLPAWGFDRAMFTPSQPCRLAGPRRTEAPQDPILDIPVHQSLLWLDLGGLS